MAIQVKVEHLLIYPCKNQVNNLHADDIASKDLNWIEQIVSIQEFLLFASRLALRWPSIWKRASVQNLLLESLFSRQSSIDIGDVKDDENWSDNRYKNKEYSQCPHSTNSVVWLVIKCNSLIKVVLLSSVGPCSIRCDCSYWHLQLSLGW